MTITLTDAELDTLRFILGVVITEDFEDEAATASFLSLCEKVGA